MTRPLVGAGELRQLLGVNRKRVYELSRHRDFPAPRATLMMGSVWYLDEVEQWAQKTNRTLHPLDAPALDAGDHDSAERGIPDPVAQGGTAGPGD